ncbi:hypothetical protein ACIQVU_10430 [Lysinibacillus sp. NPDC098008]|uniref:hypothetical protein n=1 Tax=Lysinibacillus sp. NPDC098008 TaxID=3364146 RepID=UPI0038068CE1
MNEGILIILEINSYQEILDLMEVEGIVTQNDFNDLILPSFCKRLGNQLTLDGYNNYVFTFVQTNLDNAYALFDHTRFSIKAANDYLLKYVLS